MKATVKASVKTPIDTVIRPVMQLRAGLDRVTCMVLREKMGFGVSQLRILYVLAFKPDITQKNIADFWDVTEASVSRQIRVLEKKGFISRSTATSAKPSLSPAGKQALDTAMKYTQATFEKIFKDISSSERKSVAHILEKLIEKVKVSSNIYDTK